MQVTFSFAGEITQVLAAIPWVRCASGNVYFKPNSEAKFTFTFCIVNVNFVQLKDACDQGRMVETCCAKENIEY